MTWYREACFELEADCAPDPVSTISSGKIIPGLPSDEVEEIRKYVRQQHANVIKISNKAKSGVDAKILLESACTDYIKDANETLERKHTGRLQFVGEY